MRMLKFFHRRASGIRSDAFGAALKILEERFFIRTRYVELDQDWYRTAAVPMLARTDDGRWLAVIRRQMGHVSLWNRAER